LLPAGHPAVYVQDEIAQSVVTIAPFAPGRRFHLYCSPDNPGAAALCAELEAFFGAQTRLVLTSKLEELGECEHMLVYLTSDTWTCETAAAFAHQVCEAMRQGVHPLLAHELPSVLSDSATRHAVPFNAMWNDSWTPRWLLTGGSNLYKQIAIALKGGSWRGAGLAKVAIELAKGGGPRERWFAEPQEPGYCHEEKAPARSLRTMAATQKNVRLMTSPRRNSHIMARRLPARSLATRVSPAGLPPRAQECAVSGSEVPDDSKGSSARADSPNTAPSSSSSHAVIRIQSVYRGPPRQTAVLYTAVSGFNSASPLVSPRSATTTSNEKGPQSGTSGRLRDSILVQEME